jgi:hypothetical protein
VEKEYGGGFCCGGFFLTWRGISTFMVSGDNALVVVCLIRKGEVQYGV